MRQIKVRDLEILEQEKQESQNSDANLAQTIADLTADNAKKDMQISDLSQTVADLNISIKQLQGGSK